MGDKTEFSIKIEAPYDADSCENIMSICCWIKDSIRKCNIACNEYRFACSFSMGDISCDCYSEEEFTKHAFGQSIRVYSCRLIAQYSKDETIYFGISRKSLDSNNLYISCGDIVMLASLKTTLMKEKNVIESALNATVNISPNINAYDSQVVIGANNTVTTIHNTESKKEDKISFWKGVWQGIAQNIVWVIVIAIITLLLTILGKTPPGWLSF